MGRIDNPASADSIIKTQPIPENSPNSNQTEPQKYLRYCRDCGEPFYSTAKNTQYCKDCSSIRRKFQIKASTNARRMKIGQTRNKTTTGHAYNIDGKRIVIPNDYMLNALSVFAAYLCVSYGKMDAWKASHADEYSEWEKVMVKDYADQKEKLKGEPRSPSRNVFEKYMR